MHSFPFTFESLRSAGGKEKCGHMKSKGCGNSQYCTLYSY